MRTKNLLLAATLLISLPLLVLAQEPDRARDEAAIRQIVQYYFDAMKNDDAESLKKAFHPKAKWLNAGDKGYLWEISQERVTANLQSNVRRHMPTLNATMRIVAIDITGGVASAKIETEYLINAPPEIMPKLAYKGAKTAEYLSLIKFDDGWKIVSRISSGEQTPATLSFSKARANKS
jgi:hypothetical protein